jgi:hypothetical protein
MTIDQIRVLTADLPAYDRATALGDGVTTEYRIIQYPVIAGSAKVYVGNVLQAEAAYELDTEVGLLVFDNAPGSAVGIVVTYRHAILSDANITALMGIYPSVKRAAAAALETIASNEALVQKKIKSLDLQTDGPAVAKSLREHASQLRKEAEADETDEESEEASFDIAEMVLDPFGARENLLNQRLRGL